MSGLQIAAETLSLYNTFDREARTAFFDALVEEFSPNTEAVWKDHLLGVRGLLSSALQRFRQRLIVSEEI